VFARGETQAVCLATLGTSDDIQQFDSYTGGETKKQFLLHYNFPNFSVGETGRITGPGRREIGHGALAERSVRPVIPLSEYPYAVRITAEIMESNGSTSMASVCGATLALMDAGVPITRPVAGISIGICTEYGADHQISRYKLLTDIIGWEDAFCDMDCKIAGTDKGITGFQLDLKLKGIPLPIMEQTIEKARVARGQILAHMLTTLPAPRSDISKYAPRIVTLKINPEKIGALIGPGGKNIKRLVEESGCEINIEDDGTVKVFSVSPEGMEIARREIEALSAEIQIGKVYKGRVVTIKEFGAFIEVFPGQDGLVHVSELSNKRVARVEDVIKMGDDIWVKCIGVDEKGRVKLSRKAAMEERGEIPPSTGAPEEGAPAASEGEARPERAERPERGGDRGGDRGPRGGDRGGDRGGRGGDRGGDRGADRGGRGERGGRRGDAPAGGEGEGSGEPLEIGKIYRAKVVTIKDFGAFVEFLPGREGLVHVSELANFRVKQVEDIVQLGDEIWVKLLGQDEKGRVRLSRKAAMEEREKAASGDAPAANESANGGSSADAQE
jgi:polyribonucleotide nucleotidyltransferase